MNQEIEQYLQLFISHQQDDWPEWIAIAEFSYNNKICMSMKMSHFFTNYGYHPWIGVEPHHHMKVEAVNEYTS